MAAKLESESVCALICKIVSKKVFHIWRGARNILHLVSSSGNDRAICAAATTRYTSNLSQGRRMQSRASLCPSDHLPLGTKWIYCLSHEWWICDVLHKTFLRSSSGSWSGSRFKMRTDPHLDPTKLAQAQDQKDLDVTKSNWYEDARNVFTDDFYTSSSLSNQIWNTEAFCFDSLILARNAVSKETGVFIFFPIAALSQQRVQPGSGQIVEARRDCASNGRWFLGINIFRA